MGNFSGTAQGANEWTSDPKFTSATDFHLQNSSPAIDVGTISLLLVDKDNSTRPVGLKPDLGCYESSSAGGGGDKIYYVRVTGNDSNNGLARTTAFRTIKKAATVAKSGDKVYIGAGTYTDAVSVSHAGTSSKPIEFIGDVLGANTGDAGTVIVSGTTATVWLVNGKDYISLSNLRFSATGTGTGTGTVTDTTTDNAVPVVLFQSSVGNQITSCHFKNGKDALRVKGSDVTLSGCKIESLERNGIFVEDAASKLTVRLTTIELCNEIGIFIKKASSVLVDQSSVIGNGGPGIRTDSDQSAHTLVGGRSRVYSNREGFHFHGNSTITIENSLSALNREMGINACWCAYVEHQPRHHRL